MVSQLKPTYGINPYKRKENDTYRDIQTGIKAAYTDYSKNPKQQNKAETGHYPGALEKPKSFGLKDVGNVLSKLGSAFGDKDPGVEKALEYNDPGRPLPINNHTNVARSNYVPPKMIQWGKW